MKYINFKNLDLILKNQEEFLKNFIYDKSKTLSEYHANLNEKDLNKESSPNFNCGYAVCGKNEIILDTDNEDSNKFIFELIEPFKDKVRIEKTRKGYHFYLELTQNIKGKKDIKFNKKNVKIELKGQGSWVFTSSDDGVLKDYYKVEKPDYSTLSEEDTEYLLSALFESMDCSIGYLLSKDSSYLPFSDSRLSICVKSVLEEQEFNAHNIPLFVSVFRKRFYENLNPYDCTFNDIKIPKGDRNNGLFSIFSRLGIVVDIESKEDAIEFLRIVNKELLERPLSDSEFNASFNVERYDQGRIKFFTKQHMAALRTEFLKKNIYQNLSQDAKTKEEFYVIEKSSEKPTDLKRFVQTHVIEYGDIYLLIQKIPSGDLALLKTIKADSLLSSEYIKKEVSKNGKVSEKIDKMKIPGVRFIRQGEYDIDPFKRIENKYEDGSIVIDFSTQHYSNMIKQSNRMDIPEESVFLEIPYVKLAIENLFGSKEKLALFLSDIGPSILNKRPTKRASILCGSGGIGKDAFMDYIADCFLYKRITYFKDTQDSIRRDSQFTEPLANATIVHLNEAGVKEKEIDSSVLSGLNRYIDNNSNIAEAKHQNAKLIDSHLLLCVLSTNSGVDISMGYNNTRYIYFQCIGAKPLRSDDGRGKSNREYFFGDKSRDQIIEETSSDFINFVLYSEKLQEWATNAKDDSDLFREESLEIEENTDIGKYESFIYEMEKTKLQNLIDWGNDLPLYYEAKNSLDDFKLRLYINLPANIRGQIDVRTFSVLGKNGVPKKISNADRILTTLYRIVPWLMQSYRNIGEYVSKTHCRNMIRNGVIEKFLRRSDRIQFSSEYIKIEGE